MPYGQQWRDHRRAFWQIFHPAATREYREIQSEKLRTFLAALLESPQYFQQHIRYNFSATVMKLLYDLDAKEKDDEFIAKVEESMALTSEHLTGSHPVDVFPFLRHVPGWVPGAGFQYEFARCKTAVTYVKEAPFALMKAALDRGENVSCSLATLLSRIGGQSTGAEIAYREEIIKNVGLIAFEGGSDSSFSTIVSVFLAMTLYPEVQKKAQAELDAVVGPHRLPGFEDRDALVYINAIVKEALRWHVVFPLSLPHRTIEDDIVDGYFIPAGSLIMPNTWAILHDPEAYDAPEEFRPERFIRDGKLDPSVRAPYAYAFGYGRRACAGRHFADEALFLTIASVLHVFNIDAPLDDEGRPVKTELRQTNGLLTYPEECRCVVTPRSEEAISLISSAY
ncbi:cytochrome P450 [Cubamyces menziesii]|nr:cytochrome P450 [Cubamyces menziesii]